MVEIRVVQTRRLRLWRSIIWSEDGVCVASPMVVGRRAGTNRKLENKPDSFLASKCETRIIDSLRQTD
jgi:hypothetical protein